MSGHSKWATTKHKKAANDAKRAKSFAKLIKAIEVAAKIGGADLAGNPTLQDVVTKAKKNSVPNDNIDRAIKRGAGLTGENVNYHSVTYEGYGPGGVAFLVECLTDNKNRAAAEVRTAMSRNGGSLADPGSVAYNFQRKGVVLLAEQKTADGTPLTEDAVLDAVLDVGAEDIDRLPSGGFEIVCEAGDLGKIRDALLAVGLEYDSAEAEMVASVKIGADPELAKKVFWLIDALEESDDVQNVYTSVEISEEVARELEE